MNIDNSKIIIHHSISVPPMIAQPFPTEVSFVSFPNGSFEVMVGQMVTIPADRELNIRCNVTEVCSLLLYVFRKIDRHIT